MKIYKYLTIIAVLALVIFTCMGAFAETPAPQHTTPSAEPSEIHQDTEKVETTPSANKTDIAISPDAFLASLVIMGKGMLGIFVVTIAIMLVIVILNKSTKKKDNSNE